MGLVTYLLSVFAVLAIATAADDLKEGERIFDCTCLMLNLGPDNMCDKVHKPVTYPGVGTFTAELGCHRKGWPPKSPDDINTKFYLYTYYNPKDAQRLRSGSQSRDTHFSPDRPTRFVIHGFMSSAKSDWMIEMKDELLIRSYSNIILVDWSDGAETGALTPDYCDSRQNIRVVARLIVNLLKELQDEYPSFKLEDVHLIGHSLGGEMAAYVGQGLSGIGRISGIDTAGPEFQDWEEDCRLDPGDALFVDALHTSMFGIFEPVGHVDIYPNHGKHQTGCWYFPDIVEGTCGHSKAHAYYIASINNKCDALFYPCEWKKGQGCDYHGEPGTSQVKWGYRADETPPSKYGSYVVMVDDDHPYCDPKKKP